MNTPIKFELAKLLKEKGFDELTKIWMQHGDGIRGVVEGKRDYYNRKGDVYTSLPTIAEVVMWLYDKHGIWIGVRPRNEYKWKFDVYTKSITTVQNIQLAESNNPTEAYESAIEYTLNNLIK